MLYFFVGETWLPQETITSSWLMGSFVVLSEEYQCRKNSTYNTVLKMQIGTFVSGHNMNICNLLKHTFVTHA